MASTAVPGSQPKMRKKPFSVASLTKTKEIHRCIDPNKKPGKRPPNTKSPRERTPVPQTESQHFAPKIVEKHMKDVLEAYLYKTKYDQFMCSKLSQDLCSVIKCKIKELRYERYKLVVQVMVGQESDQSVHLASKCLWNQTTDNFAAATYRNSSLFAVATVYGMYLE